MITLNSHKPRSYIDKYGVHSSFPCVSDCISYALRKLQMNKITLKVKQRYSMEAIFELCMINLVMRMRETVCTRFSLRGFVQVCLYEYVYNCQGFIKDFEIGKGNSKSWH